MNNTVMSERDLARQLRLCYERARAAREALKHNEPASKGGAGYAAEATADVWVRLARFCAGRSIDPVAYIDWTFDNALLGRSAPAPRQLLNHQHARAFLDGLKEDGREIEVAFRVQQQTARTNMLLAQRLGRQAPPDALAAVLLDESLPLSALYRYCLATSIGGERFRRIARLYEVEAARQYRRNRADYDAVWGRWIPERLRERSL